MSLDSLAEALARARSACPPIAANFEEARTQELFRASVAARACVTCSRALGHAAPPPNYPCAAMRAQAARERLAAERAREKRIRAEAHAAFWTCLRLSP